LNIYPILLDFVYFDKMKILFISPNVSYKNKSKNILQRLSNKFLFGFGNSITFQILAALTPEKHVLEFIEGGHSQINYNENYDLVAISVVTKHAFLSYEIADNFRKRGVKVILGGWHPSALPEEAKQHADAVVIGEAENTWQNLLKDFEIGKNKPYYAATKNVEPTDIPSLKTNRLPQCKMTTVQATRGCPYTCEFCAIVNMKYRKKFRTRPIDQVISEIANLKNKGFFFIDSSLTINPKYTKELFRRMKILNKKFIAYGNIDNLVNDEELLRLSAEAGCLTWYIGFETISQDTLNKIGKSSNMVNKYFSSIKKIHDYGINIMGSFIFGFDNDTIDVFDKTDDFIKQSKVDIPLLRILTPFPGTTLFNRLDSEGRITSKNWAEYDLDHLVFRPKNMTPADLETNINMLKNKQYSKINSFLRTIRSVKFGPHIFLETAFMSFFLNYKLRE